MEVFYLFNVRCISSASWSIKQWFTSYIVFLSVGLVIILQLIFTYAPFMNALFETTPISLGHGIEIIAVGIVMYLILEIEKWLRRSITKHHQTETAN
jgi:magnesium-transporting ATPase (P-type)